MGEDRVTIVDISLDQAIQKLRNYTHMMLDPGQESDDVEEWLLDVAEAFRVIDDELIVKYEKGSDG